MSNIEPEIKTTTFGSDTTITLPPRPASVVRFVGCIPILFAIVGTIMAAVFINITFLQPPPAPFQPEAPAHPAQTSIADYVIAAVIGVPILLIDLLFVYAGIRLLLPNAVSIRITETELLLITKAGPFPKTRRRPLAEITQLRISDSFPGLQFPPKVGEPQRSSFVIDCKTFPMLTAAAGYFKPTVINAANALADELKRRNLPVNRPLTEASADPVSPVATVDDNSILPPNPVPDPDPAASASAAPVQPTTSKITFLPEPDSLTFMIPRSGVRGAAMVFLMFSLIWSGISGGILVAFIAVFAHQPNFGNFFPFLFLVPFVLIGFGMFLLFLQTAFRRTVILATPTSLIVTQNAPIRNREYQWPREEMKRVATDLSGTTVNNRQYRELRITFTNDAHKGFFDGRDDDELEWMAATIRNFYGLM